MKQPLAQATLLLIVTSVSALNAAEITTGVDDEARLPFWQWSEQGVSVRLVQRYPDQTRAFFIGRGFNTEAANLIGTGCVFQTVFRNDGKESVDYNLADWRISHNGESAPIALKEGWDEQWRQHGVSKPARIAFKWAFLPNVQHFEPGDYNWGMTSYGLAPGEKFDLIISMAIGARRIESSIENIECPPDKAL